ncbi:MAG: sugar phosphate isomerase/epimerase [Proteobacteria bacterium]|nr:sugar phosphate isomerase/epimerase [Pseudomonadota bacterium]
MPQRISFQLYSARNFQPWDGVLAHLARCGYVEVEGFGGVYEAPETFRELLDKHGLTMPTGHFFPLSQFESEKKKVLHIARTLGMRRLFCPYIPEDERPKSGAGWKAFGKRLGEVGKWVRDQGYGFGWHNHDFEFIRLKDGSTPHERIFEGGPLLDWECDIAWVAFAGHNPVKWIKAYGDRITAVHIKDNAPRGQNLDQHGQSDVGAGTIRWPEVMAAVGKTRCLNLIVEHDDPKDFTSFARNSFNFISKI